MKKIIIISILAIFSKGTLPAQQLKDAAVPAVVKTSFLKQFPGITAKWEMENENYEANFKKDGNTISALFDQNGKIMETEIDIPLKDLPSNAVAYVKEHYKGKTIKEASRITKDDGTVNYEAAVSGRDVIFDSQGKFIKEVKD